ncbi:MAG: hypothetical protein MPN21_16420 [Thermoanaerobaculia bacterium]|nr:hypothetical protein [Thermoanaerobaculia bacterium]
MKALKQQPALWLRRTLLANAGFSTFCAALFLFLADRLAGWTGFSKADLQSIGIQLGIFAALVAWVATRDFSLRWARGLAVLVAPGDTLWVVGSLLLAVGIPAGLVDLTMAGRFAVVLQAVVVADFAFLQFFCWFHLRRAVDPVARADGGAARPQAA